MSNPNYKIVVCGNAGSGKTTWLRRIRGYHFDPKYVPTLGVEVIPFLCMTNHGSYNINFWDMAGDPKFSGLGDGYMVNADACIIALDGSNTSPECNDYWKWHNMYKKMETSKPIITMQMKADMVKKGFMDLNISSKNDDAYCRRPIELVLRQITGFPDLRLIK